jgi:hypothetical protein
MLQVEARTPKISLSDLGDLGDLSSNGIGCQYLVHKWFPIHWPSTRPSDVGNGIRSYLFLCNHLLTKQISYISSLQNFDCQQRTRWTVTIPQHPQRLAGLLAACRPWKAGKM